ncbi:unnamed protein product, partial [Brassica rapa]
EDSKEGARKYHWNTGIAPEREKNKRLRQHAPPFTSCAATMRHRLYHALPTRAATDTMRRHWESREIETQPDNRRTHAPPPETTRRASRDKSLTRKISDLNQAADAHTTDSRRCRKATQRPAKLLGVTRNSTLTEDWPNSGKKNPKANRFRRPGSATTVLKHHHHPWGSVRAVALNLHSYGSGRNPWGEFSNKIVLKR